MHLLRIETRSIDESVEAVDLAQTPADIVFLSFSDSDLSCMAAAWEEGARLPAFVWPSLLLCAIPSRSTDISRASFGGRAS